MMNMNFRKISRGIISLILCLCMLGSALTMASCNKDETTPAPEENTPTEVEVLRLVDDIAAGERISNASIELVKVSPEAVPEGAISDATLIRTKYTATNMFAGDYITEEKLTTKKPSKNTELSVPVKEVDYKALGYVVITDYVKDITVGEDMSAAINKAIEENPGKTIYFPDGIYDIASPIIIPADPAKSVSLRLAHQTIIRAMSTWPDRELAMVRMGVQEAAAAAEGDEPVVPTMEEADLASLTSTYIIGGNLYANGFASGITVEGGKDTLIYNVSLKAIEEFGIHILRGNNEIDASYVNIDNVNITGTDKTGSKGVWVEGTYNTIANMRIYRIQYGTYATETAKNNVFRNLHPLASTGHGNSTVSFYDMSDGNTYDICYSDQFSTGYVMYANTRSVINGAFCYWYSEKNGYHVGFRSIGAYNSIWVGGKSAQSSNQNLEVNACVLVTLDEAGDVKGKEENLLWIPCECLSNPGIYRGQDANSDGKCDHCDTVINYPDPSVAGNGVILYPIYNGFGSSKQYVYMLDYYSRTQRL